MSVNGLVGTVLSELLWLWGCFLTSSLMATLSLSLTIPLTMFVDIWLKGIKYSLLIYIGAIPMMTSFIAVSLLTHYESWDPLMDGMKYLHRKFWLTQREWKESLTVNSADNDEAEDEEELDTTLINNSFTINSSATVISSNYSIVGNDTATPAPISNILTNHV
ncbi:Solute carrier family 35 member F5-like 1 [Homarus americanus]|uniref:Solute carrier family 35 member F5-like 1 n=1 Tax=Homarus americanus TaxID=6706 RepID=A0A8J5MNF4_HOMAM|nr:Solute carrier family 35 member F5-like 1 [Homarus americanus]